MITLLMGENSFEIKRALDRIISGFPGRAEMIDCGEAHLSDVFDGLMSVSLFMDRRLVVLNDPSANKSIWSSLNDWLPKVSEDFHVVLIEAKPDKRTLTYKMLQDYAVIQEFKNWSDRDAKIAEKWVIDEAKTMGFDLENDLARLVVSRVGVNQWQLYHALEKLALLDNITADTITDVIEANPVENVFKLFETAAVGCLTNLKVTFQILKQSEDAYKLFSLLSAQAFQLAVVANSTRADNVAKDFGVHPYVLTKLNILARSLGKQKISHIVEIFADSDNDMKTSNVDPWLILERTLIKVGTA